MPKQLPSQEPVKKGTTVPKEASEQLVSFVQKDIIAQLVVVHLLNAQREPHQLRVHQQCLIANLVKIFDN